MLYNFLGLCIKNETTFRKKLTDILNLQKLQDKQVKRHPLLALSGLVCLLGADLLFSNLTTRPYSLWDQYGSFIWI
mgnify:CR=1 FL=1